MFGSSCKGAGCTRHRRRASALASTAPAAAPLLELQELQTHFSSRRGTVRAVDGLSFALQPGRSLGLVGESGSGKSVASLSIMRLVEAPGAIVGGRIMFKGRDLATLSEREMQKLRGGAICLVFQDPMSALNPVYTVGAQLAEAIRAHGGAREAQAMARAVELFRSVGIPDPARRVHDYPHRLSGGMRQRVTIAMALANDPDLLILDEPTTALDVTIQAQILDLIRGLRERVNTAVLLVTHDIGVVREICDDVVVMYGGQLMERGTMAQVTEAPRHPYTMGLLASRPGPGLRGQKLPTIGGRVPNPLQMPPGCPFQPRCPQAMAVCSTRPGARDPGDGRAVACWLY